MREKHVKRTQEKGITLIALVVTIVVLLILAGVSIVVLFGDNGLIKQAEESSLQTKFADVEERANVIYVDLDSKRYATGNINKKVTMGEITKELSNLKYDIKEKEVGENVVEEITLEPKSIKMGTNDTAQIEVKLKKNDEGMAYYVKVEDKYYKISIENGHIILDRTNGKLENELTENKSTETTTQELNVISKDENIVTIKSKNENIIEIQSEENLGSTQIEVSYGSLEPQICNVTVAVQPVEGKMDSNITFTTSYGRVEIIWLNENDEVIEKPNPPILGQEENEMQPVKWKGEDDGNIEEKTADKTNKEEDWYNYRTITEDKDNFTSHWANAKTKNGSYFVWIPRYAYRITYYKEAKRTTTTGYYDGYGMWSEKEKTIKYKLEDGIETIEHTGKKYIIHPAFGTNQIEEKAKNQNIDMGGWDKPLTGFWFAKFEMSLDEENELVSIPNVKSIRDKNIGTYYTKARESNYGQIGTADTFDNKISFMNSHLVKNSEWGAMAFLAYSQYGRNGYGIQASNSDQMTGVFGSSYGYLVKQDHSTTGNIYGVYDASGGAYEYVAAFLCASVEDKKIYRGWTEATGLTTISNSTKYATKYQRKAGDQEVSRYYAIGKTGDATKEVRGGQDTWQNGSLSYEEKDDIFRRGYMGGSRGSIFAQGICYMLGNDSLSYRTILCQ